MKCENQKEKELSQKMITINLAFQQEAKNQFLFINIVKKFMTSNKNL